MSEPIEIPRNLIDVKSMFAAKNPRLLKILPGFLFSILKKILHQDTINGYIYMGNANVNEGKFYDTIDHQVTTQRFSYFFNNKSKIFDDGYGKIWA